ncbi:MAG: polysaccharide deacetylase family protein [Lawsonibacter sp.]
MRDFVENEVGSLRDHGAPGISWALLVLCFALAFSPAPQPAGDRAASGSAEVEVETGPEMPVVALTFDDGPRAATTGRLLDELALREVPATFFLLGHRLSGNEELVRRMAREGHQIGVHTFDHVPVTGLSHQEFDLQVGASAPSSGTFWGMENSGCAPRTARQMTAPGPGRTALLCFGRWIRRTGRTTTPPVSPPP